MSTPQESTPFLEVKGLKVHFEQSKGFFFPEKTAPVKAVDGVDLVLKEGQTMGLVGESGCGKSTTARAIMQLLAPSAGKITFQGVELLSLKGEALRQQRRAFQIIFQDPYASLNPRMTVEQIIREPLINFGIGNEESQRAQVRELLDEVGLPANAAARYPHEFSGGQRQRISIARALAPKPKLVVCDEPVSALDVSVQAQILGLLKQLQEQYQLTYLFISHDLAVVRYLCDEVAVMYKGKIVEQATASSLFAKPLHPYTELLLDAIPRPDPSRRRQRRVPPPPPQSQEDKGTGCAFAPRCHKREAPCFAAPPPLQEATEGHLAACILHQTPTE